MLFELTGLTGLVLVAFAPFISGVLSEASFCCFKVLVLLYPVRFTL